MFGLRTGKTVKAGEVTESTSFIYENGRLLRQKTGDEKMDFFYGSEGVIGFKISGSSDNTDGNYLYRKNLFGDIIGIIDESGALIYEYGYDAFGKSEKEEETGIGAKNPFRYRSYYFDDETGLYYLKSRYYDPEVGRFITIDNLSYIDPETINGLNLYAYCGNNPVMRVDENGNAWWDWLLAGLAVVGLVIGSVFTGGLLGAAFVGAAIGGGISLITQAIGGKFNWGQFALDIGIGALTGMLGMSGISRAGATLLGGLIGGVSNIGSQLIGGASWNEINWWKVGISTVVGGVSSYFGGPGARNVQKLNSSSRVSKAIDSVNKVFARQNTGYYSAARYANAAFTNVTNRLGKAVAKQQLIMFVEAMVAFGVGTALNYGLTFWW